MRVPGERARQASGNRDGRRSPRILAALLAASLVTFFFHQTMIDWLVRQMLYPAPPVAVPAEPPAGLVEATLGPDGVVAWGRPGDDLPPERPMVLCFHGNGENLGTMARAGLFERLDTLDVAYIASDYPGYGRSGGTPSEESLLSAAHAALERAADRAPERPLVVAGWSLGAAVAARLAARNPERVEGLILLSPWATLADVAAVHYPAALVRPVLAGRYDTLAAVSALDHPALVIHGERDRIIPAEQGERVAAALFRAADEEHEVRWVPVSGAGHNDLLSVERVWEEMEWFFDRVSARGERTAS